MHNILIQQDEHQSLKDSIENCLNEISKIEKNAADLGGFKDNNNSNKTQNKWNIKSSNDIMRLKKRLEANEVGINDNATMIDNATVRSGRSGQATSFD